jgi:putative ABC transport system permease protein
MIRNFVLISIRVFLKHRAFSSINLFGLTIGIACFNLIILYVFDELSYDRFHNDSDRIHRVVKDFVNKDGTTTPDATTPPALLPALLTELPEVEQATRIFPSWGYKPLVAYRDKAFYEESFLRVDSAFFSVFSFPFVRGDARSAFAEPLSVVLTESFAKKYFGDVDPMGKSLTIDRNASVNVSGIVQDVPPQSHFKFDFLLSLRSLSRNASTADLDGNWGWYNFYTYVKTRSDVPENELNRKIQTVFNSHQPTNDNVFYTQKLAGLKGIHLNSHLKWELSPNGDRLYVIAFLTIALSVLAIAGINYVNLSTGRSSLRTKEVGLRKVVGAERRSLIVQFMAESVFMTFGASIAAIGLTELALPFFNEITQKNLSLFSVGSTWIWVTMIGATVVLGLLAGLYPAAYLSSFQPIEALKKLNAVAGMGFNLRKMLVVFQFSLSIMLIVGLLIVHRQMEFMQDAKLGFDKDQVVVIRNARALPDRGEPMRAALERIPGVQNVAVCDGMIGGQNWTNSLRQKGSDNSQLVNFLSVGYGFLDVLGIELKEGRDFSPAFPTDTLDAIILNETAVRQLGVHEPAVGQQIIWAENQDTTYYAGIIGVVKDFHFTSLHQEIKPFAFVITPARTWLLTAKISGPDVRQTLVKMESAWSAMMPDRPFDYYFLDESIDKLYQSERHFRTVFSVMTVLSLIIACLGLLGLASFATEQRTKEIGIRKVMGASVSGLVSLLSRDFLTLVLLANLVAWPIAWFTMSAWLENFAYRIHVELWTFILAGSTALIIALFTVSTQAVKAALANPVEALKYE